MIVAVEKNMGIGSQGKVPWKLSSDLRRFKRITLHHHILMGRKTYQSIGKPLPERINLVISHDKDFLAPGCHVFTSIEAALEFAKKAQEKELFVIGGAEIYRHIFPLAQNLYLTRVQAVYENMDTFFPEFLVEDWKITEKQHFQANDRDEYDSVFIIYKRKR